VPEASDVTVVSVGEGLVVFTPEPPLPLAEAETFARSLGGAELNVAIALQTAGVRSAVIGRVGDDGFGDFLVAELGRYGVDTSGLERDPHAPTGLYVKEVSSEASGIADRMHYYRSSSAGSLLSPETLAAPAARGLLEHARVVHTSGVTSALSSSALRAQEWLFQGDRESGIRSFSVHWRPPLWLGREDVGREALAGLARRADVVFVSEADALSVFGATDAGALRALLPEPRHLVVIHPTGATAFDGGTRAEAPPIDFRMIEPIGAEDAIAAGFLAGLISGLSLEGSLARANRLATRVMSSTRDHLG
jgi:2-dehydro-3-deoxygluconokinase